MESQHTTHAVAEISKATPPIAVGGLTLFGVGLSDWVLILTLIYTILQIGFLIRDKVWRHYGRKRNDVGPSP